MKINTDLGPPFGWVVVYLGVAGTHFLLLALILYFS